ncbi:unnamed protein product [Tilletia controversa]|nr:unnamed protein product [Tilletia controversa]
MTTPSQLSIALPPQFQTSFWSAPDYRRGAQHLYSRLQTGIDENHNVIQIIQHRADAEFAHADNLATQAARTPYPAPPLFKNALTYQFTNKHNTDYDYDDAEDSPSTPSAAPIQPRGESNLNISQAIRAIEAESLLTQANAHAKVANHLQRLVLQPFRKWSAEHRDRVSSSWNHVDASIQRFERQHTETDKLRTTYENNGLSTFPSTHNTSITTADSSSTAAAASGDDTASAVKTRPLDKDRIKRRETLRQQFGFRARSPGFQPGDDDLSIDRDPANSTRAEVGEGEFAGITVPTATPDASSSTKLSSGAAGRRSFGSQRPSASEQSPSAADLDDVALGSLSPGSSSLKRSATLSSYLSSAVGRISGEGGLAASVKGLVGGLAEPRHIRARRDAESAERAYADAVISLDRTRCVVEEILFEHFVLLQRFETDRLKAVKAVLMSYHASFTQLVPTLAASLDRIASFQETIVPEADLQRLIADGRTGPYKPVAQVFHPGGFGMNLDAYTRAEALAREDASSTTTPGSSLVKPKSGGAHSRSPSLVGPNKGMPAVPLVLGSLLSALERAYADPKRWPQPPKQPDGEGAMSSESALLLASAEKRKSWIYEVPLSAIHRLRDILVEPHLLRAIAGLSEDESFDHSFHADGANGNGASGGSSPRPAISPSNLDLDRYDPPVLASTLKVWALELEQSLVPSDLWDSAAAIYEAAAGQERDARAKKEAAAAAASGSASKEGEEAEGENEENAKTPTAESAAAGAGGLEKGKGRASSGGLVGPNGVVVPEPLDAEVQAKIRADVIQDLTALLSKVPKIHLACLDAVVGHLHRMVKDTTTNEPELIYLNKLGLSLGRAVLRPKVETAVTLNAKHPTLLTMDLIQNYESIFPSLLARKARESELSAAHRAMPVRKRTKPVDQRLSRSQMLAAQAAQNQNGMPVLPSSGGGNAAANAASNVVTGARRLGQRIVTNVENAMGTSSQSPISTSPESARKRLAAAGEEEEEGVPPTPIASRVLQGARADTLKGSTGSAATAPAPAPSTPVHASASAGSNSATAPLSNVARLSRQFGGGGSGGNSPVLPTSGTLPTLSGAAAVGGAGGVRGPRPAGARSARPSGASASGSESAPAPASVSKRAVDRESKDLAPSTQLGEDLKRTRRRSWSRTVDSSDALAAADDDDE